MKRLLPLLALACGNAAQPEPVISPEDPRTVKIKAICKALQENPIAYEELERLVSLSNDATYLERMKAWAR